MTIKNKLILFACYSLALLFIGRNLSFLPSFKHEQKVADLSEKEEKVHAILADSKGAYSVYYEDLTTNDSFGIDDHKVLTAASINKLFIVGYLYSLADQGKIDLSEKITIQESDIQDYGTGSLRYAEPGGTYSLQELSRLAFKQSDNTASYVLGIRLQTQNIQRFVDDLGLEATDIENNLTSAHDVGMFLRLLYDNHITSSAYTQELFDYLTDTDFEDRLALFMKKNARVIHKTGDAVNMIHDGGIIDDGGNPYIIVVLSSEVSDEERAKVTIGKIAHVLWRGELIESDR